eukprot:6920006-Pyramimonas_sp.AAC.1
MLADGRAPGQVAPLLGGATLLASEKKSGDVWPIAVGEVLRRLTAKTLAQVAKDRAQEYFWPVQTGVASPLGCECAVHT